MEVIRHIIDGNVLEKIMTIPRSFRNRKVEVIFLPVEETTEMPFVTREMIHRSVEGSVVQSLLGSIPGAEDVTLDDIRKERLHKYDYPD